MGSAFAQTSIAVHFCWLTAHMYEEQISTGVTAVTHKPVVSLFCLAALNSRKCICPDQHCSAFLLAHCIPVRRANLYRCDCSDTQPCCEPVLPSSTDVGNTFAQTSAAVHFCWLTAHMYEEQISTGVIAVTLNPAVCLFCLAALKCGKYICPDQHCSAFLLAHCTHV